MNNSLTISIPMYHYVRDYSTTKYKRIKGMDIFDFKKQLEFFSKNYHVVSMEQVLEWIIDKTELPERAMLLTFDDGYIDNYEYVFPILNEYGFQGSFFVPGRILVEHSLLDVNKIHYILASQSISVIVGDLRKKISYYRGLEYDFPDFDDLYSMYAVNGRWDKKDVVFVKRLLQTVLPAKVRKRITKELYDEYVGIPEDEMSKKTYMSREQVASMKKGGMHIGVHGYNHDWLENLSTTDMKDDIDRALSVLAEYIDVNCWSVCYPKGSYSDEVEEYCIKRGAKLGFTAEYGVFDGLTMDKMQIPRIDCNFYPPISEKYLRYLP